VANCQLGLGFFPPFFPFTGGGISAANVAMCDTKAFRASADPCCTDKWKLVRSEERTKGSALAAKSLATFFGRFAMQAYIKGVMLLLSIR